MKPSVRILILNYNGRDLLDKYLPSFLEAIRGSRFECRLTVLDNCSTDGSAEHVRSAFPQAEVFAAKENRVLCSYNDAAEFYQEDILIFMNNDIRVHRDFVDPLVEPFLNDPHVFFVTCRCLSLKDDAYEGNKTKGGIRFGIYWSTAMYPGHEKDIDRPGPTIQGGFGAFDRKKFLELGGYDDLYLPGRLEDADICFRAYTRGWSCLYEPRSIVYHEGGTSFHKAFGTSGTLRINWRNTFLFMWKNLSDASSWASFYFWLPARLLHAALTGRFDFIHGFFEALGRRREALSRRRLLKKQGWLGRVPDRVIFGQVP